MLNIEASTVESSLAGSGDLTLKGKTNSLEARVAGSGDFHWNFKKFVLNQEVTNLYMKKIYGKISNFRFGAKINIFFFGKQIS